MQHLAARNQLVNCGVYDTQNENANGDQDDNGSAWQVECVGKDNPTASGEDTEDYAC